MWERKDNPDENPNVFLEFAKDEMPKMQAKSQVRLLEYTKEWKLLYFIIHKKQLKAM